MDQVEMRHWTLVAAYLLRRHTCHSKVISMTITVIHSPNTTSTWTTRSPDVKVAAGINSPTLDTCMLLLWPVSDQTNQALWSPANTQLHLLTVGERDFSFIHLFRVNPSVWLLSRSAHLLTSYYSHSLSNYNPGHIVLLVVLWVDGCCYYYD